MRYIAELLVGKPLSIALRLLAFGGVIFFGSLFTIAEIVDIILTSKGE